MLPAGLRERFVLRIRGFAALVACSAALTLAPGSRGFAGQQPLPGGADAYTAAKHREDMIKAREYFVRLYQQHTKDPKEVQAKAVEFLRAVHREWAPQAQREKMAALAEMGSEVKRSGSHDPLVETYASYVTIRSDTASTFVARTQKEESLLEEAAKNYKEHGYPASAAFMNARFQYEIAARTMDAAAKERFLAECIRCGAALVGDKTIPRDDQRMVVGEVGPFCETLPLPDRWEFIKACNAQPDAKLWTVNYLAGAYYVDLAWHHRGSGWANSVTEEGAKLFEKNLKLGAKHLKSAWEAQPKFPEAPYRMIAVAMAGGCEESSRDWFDRTVAAQFDYEPAYSSLMNALLPRWGGSHEELYAFGRECLATKRFDTRVPTALLRALRSIDNDRGGNGDVFRNAEMYADAKTCLEGMIHATENDKDAAAQRDYRQYVMEFLSNADIAGKHADGRKLLDELGDNFQKRVLGKDGRDLPYFVSRIFALSGEGAESAREARELLNARKWYDAETMKKARALVDAAQAKNKDDRAKVYFGGLLASIKLWEDLQTGRWVDLPFDKDLTGWPNVVGQWEAKDAKRVAATGLRQTQMLTLGRKVSLAPPYEIEVEMSWEESDVPRFYAGLKIGDFVQGSPTPSHGRFFAYHPLAQSYCLATPDNGAVVKRLSPVTNPVKLRIKVWEHRYAFYVNDDLKVDRSDDRFEPGGVISLGSAFLRGTSGQVQFSNLRMRKLDEKDEKAEKAEKADKADTEKDPL